MRILVKKVPGIIFVLLAIFPLAILYLRIQGFIDWEIASIQYLFLFVGIMEAIWYLSLNDCFNKEIECKPRDQVPAFLIAVIILCLLGFLVPYLIYYLVVIEQLIFIYVALMILPKARVLFEERSVWFLVSELLGAVLGMTTLTAEIQRWEQTKRNEF
jgi:hypothetical protein